MAFLGDFLLTYLPLGVMFCLLAVVAVALAAFLWPSVEWQLLCWLQRRRRERELRGAPRPKVAQRRLR